MTDEEPLPTRHDGISVMSEGMKAMAKHSDRIAAENAELRQRVKELTELAAGTTKEQTISKS